MSTPIPEGARTLRTLRTDVLSALRVLESGPDAIAPNVVKKRAEDFVVTVIEQ